MRLWHVGCSLIVIGGLGMAARGEDIHETMRQIRARYDQIDAALAHKDLKAYASLHTADCTFKGLDGKTYKLADLTRALSEPGAPRIDSAATDIRMIVPLGKDVAVDTELTLTMQVVDRDGKQGPKGAKHSVSLHTLDHDLWVKSAGGWLRRRGEMKSLLGLKVDGKAVPRPHGIPGGSPPH